MTLLTKSSVELHARHKEVGSTYLNVCSAGGRPWLAYGIFHYAVGFAGSRPSQGPTAFRVVRTSLVV